jgi:hypothetical protein
MTEKAVAAQVTRAILESVRAGGSKSAALSEMPIRPSVAADFWNKIGQERTRASPAPSQLRTSKTILWLIVNFALIDPRSR